MAANQEKDLNPVYMNYVETISRICCDFHINSLKPQIAAIGENIHEGNFINVALVGGFKAGKSSFINSIIGKDVLPVAVLPLTSVITYIRYGVRNKAQVELLNGQTTEIPLEKLIDYISEDNNPKNVKQIKRVDVELVCLEKYRGIQFVDTPGIGSVYKHNTVTSTEWLPRVGAAFLAVSVVQPLSEGELELLKELDNYTCEIVLLLTKIDLVGEIEADKVVQFIRSQVKQQLNKDLQIFPFSNKSGFGPSQQAVHEFTRQTIVGNRLQKADEIITHKLRSVLLKCHEYLLLGASAANSTQESRQGLLIQIEKERQALSSIQNEIWLIANDLKERVHTDSSGMFERQNIRVSRDLLHQLKEDMPGWRGNLEKTSHAFRHWVETNFVIKLKPISDEFGPQLSERYLNMALDSYTRVVRAFQDRLAQAIEKALHTQFAGAKFEVKIKEPKSPDVYIGNIFMTPWEIVWFLVPMRLFRPLVNGHFLHRLPWDIEVNLTRLASQWTESLSVSMDDIAQQAKVFIRQEIDTVENLLNKAPDKRREIEKAISELEGIKNLIK